jgi:2-haloacid dehalogenase
LEIKAIVFDVYGTLFDVFSISKACEHHFPDKGEEISKVWRQKQLEYSFLRQLMDNYIPFFEITKDALKFACESQQVILTPKIEKELLEEYLSLTPFAEVPNVLKQFKAIKLAVFSNGSFNMLIPLLDSFRLKGIFSRDYECG